MLWFRPREEPCVQAVYGDGHTTPSRRSRSCLYQDSSPSSIDGPVATGNSPVPMTTAAVSPSSWSTWACLPRHPRWSCVTGTSRSPKSSTVRSAPPNPRPGKSAENCLPVAMHPHSWVDWLPHPARSQVPEHPRQEVCQPVVSWQLPVQFKALESSTKHSNDNNRGYRNPHDSQKWKAMDLRSPGRTGAVSLNGLFQHENAKPPIGRTQIPPIASNSR